ncbi:MAG TPA: septum formation family protein [Acidimicrobiales bacterium]|nr:septum formation family protein [Acidimicrobiales bacterium]
MSALGGALLLALALAAGACGGDDDDEDAAGDGSAETTSPEAEDETVFALEVGDCLASDPTGETVSEVPMVDCAEPHVSEVFHTTAIDAEELPSAADIEGIVQEECFAQFESFVGMAYEESALEITFLQPSDESWEQGDRELVCMITDPAGQTSGTLEGANR